MAKFNEEYLKIDNLKYVKAQLIAIVTEYLTDNFNDQRDTHGCWNTNYKSMSYGLVWRFFSCRGKTGYFRALHLIDLLKTAESPKAAIILANDNSGDGDTELRRRINGYLTEHITDDQQDRSDFFDQVLPASIAPGVPISTGIPPGMVDSHIVSIAIDNLNKPIEMQLYSHATDDTSIQAPPDYGSTT